VTSAKQSSLLLRVVTAAALGVLRHAEISAIPAPPVLNQPQVVGSTVTLSWIVPAGTTGIRLEAGTAPGLSNAANTVVGPISWYTAEGVPAGVYYVRVRAIDPTGESAPSNEIAVTVGIGGGSCLTAPDPPLNEQPLPMGGGVALGWSPARSGCPATTFSFEAGSAPGLSDLAVVNVGRAISFAAPLPAGGLFYTRVRAHNAYGTSLASTELLHDVPAASCPEAVPGTVTGCWLGSVSFGDGLSLSMPRGCTPTSFHVSLELRQFPDFVSGFAMHVTAVENPRAGCPFSRFGLDFQLRGTVLGNMFTTDLDFADIGPLTFTGTFTQTRMTGSVVFTGVSGVAGSLSLKRVSR
jgi:hypothetical protein